MMRIRRADEARVEASVVGDPAGVRFLTAWGEIQAPQASRVSRRRHADRSRSRRAGADIRRAGALRTLYPQVKFKDAYQEQAVAKPNYHHARKQKEQARKTRQLKKEQRRSDKGKPEGDAAPEATQPGAGDTGPPAVSGG
jgi:hypothetical protein